MLHRPGVWGVIVATLLSTTWNDGLEGGWTGFGAFASIRADAAYDGAYGVRCEAGINISHTLSDVSEFYSRFYMKLTTDRATGSAVSARWRSNTGTVTIGRFAVSSTSDPNPGVPYVAIGDSGTRQYADSANVLALNTWYRIEIYGRISATGQ